MRGSAIYRVLLAAITVFCMPSTWAATASAIAEAGGSIGVFSVTDSGGVTPATVDMTGAIRFDIGGDIVSGTGGIAFAYADELYPGFPQTPPAPQSAGFYFDFIPIQPLDFVGGEFLAIADAMQSTTGTSSGTSSWNYSVSLVITNPNSFWVSIGYDIGGFIQGSASIDTPPGAENIAVASSSLEAVLFDSILNEEVPLFGFERSDNTENPYPEGDSYVDFSSIIDGQLQLAPNATGYLALFGTIESSAAISVVPIPASVWLLGSALGLLGWFKRKTV